MQMSCTFSVVPIYLELLIFCDIRNVNVFLYSCKYYHIVLTKTKRMIMNSCDHFSGQFLCCNEAGFLI